MFGGLASNSYHQTLPQFRTLKPMPNYSATWVSLHKDFSYAKKKSVAERKIYTVAQFNFHLFKEKAAWAESYNLGTVF